MKGSGEARIFLRTIPERVAQQSLGANQFAIEFSWENLYITEKIRNIGLFGHGGSGKTSFAEAALFHTGANTRIGKVDDDSSVMNYEPGRNFAWQG